MNVARLMSILAAVAVVLAGLLGWAYANARRELQEAQATAEKERLRSQGLLVEEQTRRSKVESELEKHEKENAILKAEIERVVKLIPGATLEGFFHIKTEPGKVGGEKRDSGKPAKPAHPQGFTAPAGPALARPVRFPSIPNPGPGRPLVQWARLDDRAARPPLHLASAGQPADPEASSATSAPTASRPGTGPVPVGGAPRGADERGGEAGSAAREIASPGECVLAAGDDAEIEIDEAHLVTKAKNTVVVGTAKMNRVAPPPQTTIFAAKFSTGQLSQVSDGDKASARGWGVGVYGTAWDGGASLGPVLGFPSLTMLGHALDTSVMVGFGSKLQIGASAIARF